jgi:DNA primase
LSGSAFSEQQADKALVGAPANVVLMFDLDSAGQSALRNAYSRLCDQVDDLQAVRLPPDTDPAELLHREGPTALLRRLERATDAADLIVDMQLDSWPATKTGAEADVARVREVASLIIDLGMPDVAHQAARIRRRLPFDDAAVACELADAVARSGPSRNAESRDRTRTALEVM